MSNPDPTAAPGPGPTASIPPPPPETPKVAGWSRSRILVVVSSLALLAFAVGVDLLQRSADISGPGTSSAAVGNDRSGDSAPSQDRPTPMTAGQSARVADYDCWNGRSDTKASNCTLPSGMKGMAWIFADSAGSNCDKAPPGDREGSVFCDVAGTSVHYSEWRSSSEAEDEYAFGQASTRVANWAGYWRWNIAARDGSSKLALVHPTAPYSMTIYAETPELRDRVLRGLELRPLKYTRGRPRS